MRSHLTYANAFQSATAFVGCLLVAQIGKGLETVTGWVIGALSLGILLAGYRVVRAPELRAFGTHAAVWPALHGECAITWDAREPSVREQRANR